MALTHRSIDPPLEPGEETSVVVRGVAYCWRWGCFPARFRVYESGSERHSDHSVSIEPCEDTVVAVDRLHDLGDCEE